MTDPDRDLPPRRMRRTIIEPGDGERGGGGYGGGIALILLLILVGGIAWFLMHGGSTRSASETSVNVSLPKAVNVKVPAVSVDSDKPASNTSR
jgi:hypothetical protein